MLNEEWVNREKAAIVVEFYRLKKQYEDILKTIEEKEKKQNEGENI